MPTQKNEPAKFDVNVPQLAMTKIFDEEGKEILCGKLWAEKTAVLIFLRHFACIACRTHARQVWEHRDQLQNGGGRIHFIGNGSPHFIKQFKYELRIEDAPVFTDPSLQSYRSCGFKRGFLSALGPKSIKDGLKMAKDGNKQGAYEKAAGDLWQLGGVVVLDTDGRVKYHYISEAIGDFPPEADVGRQST